MNKIRWGILSTARIGITRVIAAMQMSPFCEITAIASRDLARAQQAAAKLDLPKAYGSYEALLADPEIDAVYNPLPNHLHLPVTLQALQAGKHVLLEKPFTMNAAEAEKLHAAVQNHANLQVMEAFMYRFHPQWRQVRTWINEGAIGQLRTVHSFFTYYKIDPDDIRQKPGMGGGGLLDIGCYCVSLSRLLFASEPLRVIGWAEQDPQFGIDRLASGILEFPSGTATFTCATQVHGGQGVTIQGTTGSIIMETPFTPAADQEASLTLQHDGMCRQVMIPAADQYTLQADAFSQAILEGRPIPWPIDDAVANMRVIDAMFASSEQNKWIKIEL